MHLQQSLPAGANPKESAWWQRERREASSTDATEPGSTDVEHMNPPAELTMNNEFSDPSPRSLHNEVGVEPGGLIVTTMRLGPVDFIVSIFLYFAAFGLTMSLRGEAVWGI